MVRVAYTSTGPSRFGTMWRARIAGGGTPSARAASMNSRRFSASVWPRTMRAVVSQPTAPSARSSTGEAAAREQGRQDDDDEQVRQRIQHVHEAHHPAVGAAAGVAGDRAPGDARSRG